ncbi:SMI1/KNR4 family protein [Streptomyces sp. NPDC059454]|uniref:SMI1/KNR4 family protein n=1 Tax=Streptomyces sp. NPDC059454 TaxID=3346836 RepID=UPI0036A38DF0
MWIDALGGLMPPHQGAGDAVDWKAVEGSWGTSFPQDYKAFFSVYGEGGVGDCLSFFLPEPRAASGEPTYQGMEAETRNAESLWTAGAEHEVPPRLIAWGVDGSADILCWRVTNGDADSWPVLVWNQDDARWSEFPCGMIEFLVRIFRAEFDECPLGAVTLWGSSAPTFLHAREQARLRAVGLDPWTGEVDPYAGMFG